MKTHKKLVITSIIVLLFIFSISAVSADTLEQLNVEEGDAIWYDVTVSATGAIGVNAWTDGASENDDISLTLYSPAGTKVASSTGYYNKVSITYAATETGTYKVKVNLDDADAGGTRKISVSTPISLSASPHNKETAINIAEGDAVWYDVTVSAAGAIGVNAWTDGSLENDDISLTLYSPAGSKVTSSTGYYNKGSIIYAATETGAYKVKVNLDDADAGGTRKISVSTPISLSASPHYIETAADIAEGDAVWYDVTVSAAGAIGVNAWTDGASENDDISVTLYSPAGSKVASSTGYYNKGSVTYAATATGNYKVKVNLDDANAGGTRKISVSSPLQLLSIKTIPAPTITSTQSPIATTTISAPTGTITISSTPSGSSIYLDGSYQGKTPKIISNASAGYHNIELKLEGYSTWSDSINVVAGNTNYVSAPLVRITTIVTTNTPKPASTPIQTQANKQTQNPTTTPLTTENSVTPTPTKNETNWLLLGGALFVLLLIGALVIHMRKPKEEVQETVKNLKPGEKQNKNEINIASAFGYKGATILYKIKLENTISVPVADVRVSLFVPNVFILLEKEKSLALLKAGESKTVTFEIRPTGECGDCEVSGKVSYYETGSNRTKEIDIGSKMLSIVCPMLKVKEITETEWHNNVSNLIETEESTKEIDMPAETLFVIVSRIIKDMHMHMLKPETIQSQQLFNGVVRFFGEGVKGLRYAVQVEVVGGAKKSKLILKAWAEKEDALTGFYHGILDEIEKRVNVKGYIDDRIVQQHIHIGDKIGTQVKDSVVQRSNIGTGERTCSNCGKVAGTSEKFCNECGEKL